MQAFEIDNLTKEPFLRLSGRHSNIIITPPRLGDADAIVNILNDPLVYPALEGPPYPYEHRFALEWISKVKAATDRVWEEIQNPSSKTKTFSGSPVRIIRQNNEDGSQTYLGDCGIDRWGYPDMEDGSKRSRLVAENEARSLGDEKIIWCIGDYLASIHHGKGIMTVVLQCLIQQWAIPWMGVRQMKTTVHEGNVASIRVFEKNGFVVEKFQPKFRETAESKGGGRVGLHILIWDTSS